MMTLTTKTRLAAACLLALAATAPAFAKSAPQMVHVSLLGEADQDMSIKLDTSAGKPGEYEFMVSNDAIGTDHEVVLVKLKSKSQKITADAKTKRIDEKKLKSMGEVAGLKPGDTGSLKVKLAAGDYLLLCNHMSHYDLGMATAFTVTN